MKIIISIWNETTNKWDETPSEITRITKTRIFVDYNGETLQFMRHSGLLFGIIGNKDKDIPNHTAPYIDASELDRTRNCTLTNKPLYKRL